MSAASDCNCACPTPTITEIPGSTGATGAAGTNGTNGVNAYTLTAGVAGPFDKGDTVAFTVDSTAWASVGLVIYVEDAGYFEVTIVAANQFTGVYLDVAANADATSIANDKLVSPAGPQFAPAALPAAVVYTALTAAGAVNNLAVAAGVGNSTLTIPLTSLATGLGALAIDLLTDYVIDYKFKILKFDFVTTVAGTGAGASQIFNLEISGVNVTNTLTVNLASTAAIGQKSIGSPNPIVALNDGAAGANISIEMAAGGTVFTAGAGYFLIEIQNMDTADAVASLSDHVNDLITSLT